MPCRGATVTLGRWAAHTFMGEPKVQTSDHPRALDAGGAEILTAAEVAEILRVEETTVGDWARQGKIPSFKLGRLRRYSRSSITGYISQVTAED